MKKTVIITIAMLVCFGIMLKIGAKGVADSWQKPRQDDVKPATSSPVDRVEQEYKEYRNIDISNLDKNRQAYYEYPGEYLLHYGISWQDGMLTLPQATNICGTMMESSFPDTPIKNSEILIGIIQEEKGNPTYFAFYDSCEKGRKYSQCQIDAYTGKVIKLLNCNENEEKENIPLTAENEERAIKAATEKLSELGYGDFKKYSINGYYAPTGIDWVDEMADNTSILKGVMILSGQDVFWIGIRNEKDSLYIEHIEKYLDGADKDDAINYLNTAGKDIPQ